MKPWVGVITLVSGVTLFVLGVLYGLLTEEDSSTRLFYVGTITVVVVGGGLTLTALWMDHSSRKREINRFESALGILLTNNDEFLATARDHGDIEMIARLELSEGTILEMKSCVADYREGKIDRYTFTMRMGVCEAGIKVCQAQIRCMMEERGMV